LQSTDRCWYIRSVRVCVLASGSGGNCLWVEAGGTRALIDAGLPLRETRRRCLDVGLPFAELTDIFLTHEHADHCHAAGIFARKLSVRVHATRGTLRALRDPPPEELRFAVRAGVPVQLGTLCVTPVALPHDACEPVAYVFDDGEVRAAIVTDLGCAPPPVVRALQGLDALFLEMNHDLRMLLEGPYPWSLKQRVRSPLGHLSNAQGAALLASVLHDQLQKVVLAHLSQENNTPDLAFRAAARVLERAGSRAAVMVASQAGPSSVMEISPAPAEAPRAQQMALF
jgi:phosphoribosyl 1,2-cyclic phosphodiesterase